jgi:class 3 adenylate cyclase/tetratricopeptide (TPR) repeat protein
MRLCPVCSQENTETARFCSSCGAALTSEPPREERKVVSVLFADLVGFTSRAEQLDPEDVRAVLAPYWERLRSELEKRGGTVEKFIGDAVMALFGAPVAHDDDPLRAVGAALAIRDWAREEEDLQVRIAVNTGEALVLLGARPAEGEGMAAGDVVNTTARLQTAAPVNGVLVGETTYRATRDVVEYAEHEPVMGKGKSEPIPVWEAVQVRSRLGMDVERPNLPLVGRTRELGVIVDAFERAKSEREPQLVTLVGVPGIGKSRLVGEFFSHLEGAPDLVWWRQGRALPYGDGVSFWAVAEMVKAQAGIEENDPPDACAEKLRASVEQLVADEAECDWVTDHLLPLVGVEQRSRSGESAPAWRRYFEGLAEQRPLVMVFEDMHWADDGLLDFIDHLVDWATGVPILALATARPELLDRRQAWGGGKLNVSTIALTPLSDEEAAEIIHGVLEQAALPSETQQALLERAGGNPLYAEQFARLYMERGSADDLPLPETVQGLIAARLDGLSAEEKRIVQDASVYGKVFWSGALAANAQSLHSLERKGMLRRERRSAVGGETQYAFRHVLVRDVAYGQIPRAARGEKHLRAADWIESLGRAEDHAELLAHHLAAALELGAVEADRARVAFARAAQRAIVLHAYRSALDYSDRALELWSSHDDERAHILAINARARFRVEGDYRPLHEAVDALERVGAVEPAAELAAVAANAAWRAGREADVRELLARAERMLRGRPPSPALAAVLAEKARFLAIRREPGGAEAAEAALDVSDRLSLDELRANAIGTLGVVRMNLGDIAGAAELFARAIDVAPTGSPERIRSAINGSVAAFTDGDSAASEQWLERALELLDRSGDRPNHLWAETGLLDVRYQGAGRWDEAVHVGEELLSEFEAVGGHYLEGRVGLALARSYAARGETAAAERALTRGIARIERTSDPQARLPTLLETAFAYQLLGRHEEAASFARRAADPTIIGGAAAIRAEAAVAIARAGVSELFIALADALPPTRRWETALLVLTGRTVEAADAYARMSPNDEAFVRLLAAEQLAAAGQVAEAQTQLERALAVFRAVGATKFVRDAEGLLSAASYPAGPSITLRSWRPQGNGGGQGSGAGCRSGSRCSRSRSRSGCSRTRSWGRSRRSSCRSSSSRAPRSSARSRC